MEWALEEAETTASHHLHPSFWATMNGITDAERPFGGSFADKESQAIAAVRSEEDDAAEEEETDMESARSCGSTRDTDDQDDNEEFSEAWMDDYLLDTRSSQEETTSTIVELQTPATGKQHVISENEVSKDLPEGNLQLEDTAAIPLKGVATEILDHLDGITQHESKSMVMTSHRRDSSPQFWNEHPPMKTQVHPISATMGSKTEHVGVNTSPLKRGLSLYISPSSVSKALMKRQDSFSASTSRFQFGNTDATRKPSRILDEWKRKEIWHDFKRAEEHIAGPQGRKSISMNENDHDTVSDERRASMLQNRWSEIPSSRDEHHQIKIASSSIQQADLSTADSTVVKEHEYAIRRQTINAPSFRATTSTLKDDSVSRAEYERVVNERRRLQDEIDRYSRSATTDKDIINNLNERALELETTERENRFLKEEIQKHVMQELSSKELVKTLRDQLLLTGKSEEQLKLQTKQLMQQNQSLQTDLLEKIAGETAKIQKMAHLSAEKQSLMEEIERKETIFAHRDTEEKDRRRKTVLCHLLRIKRRAYLQSTLTTWRIRSLNLTITRTRAVAVLNGFDRLLKLKSQAHAFLLLKTHCVRVQQSVILADFNGALSKQREQINALRIQNAIAHLNKIIRQDETRCLIRAFNVMKDQRRAHASFCHSLALGYTKLTLLIRGKQKSDLRQAFRKWVSTIYSEGMRVNYEHSRVMECDLLAAKDCVFSLSREKTKLEEKLQIARDGQQRVIDQLTEINAELQLVKHGYVTTVIRDTERTWLRCIFSEWRIHTNILNRTKHLRLQLEMAELKAAEREKYSKSLDDYNRVLRNDLERFQFFSQDKRIAVDVLTKKLLREEEKYKQMEEHQVALEEKLHALKSQLATFIEWEGLVLPLSMLALCKDIAVTNLRELFLLHATVDNSHNVAVPGLSITANSSKMFSTDDPTPRLAMDSLIRMLEYSNLLEHKLVKREELVGTLISYLPDYAVERGLLFPDFLTGMNKFLDDTLSHSDNKSDKMREFWASLLTQMGLARGSSSGDSVAGQGNNIILCPARGSWAGKLSDEILQNQEKLLAVLEHETAVVERAVMEKASLKHTYPTSDHSASVGSTYYEYQCDPMIPPDGVGSSSLHIAPLTSVPCQNSNHQSPIQSEQVSDTTSSSSIEMYSNWHLSAQVRDLFLGFQQPLLKVLIKYSNDTRVLSHQNQYCLPLYGIFRMLEDMKLLPAHLSREIVQLFFKNFCDQDGLLTPPSFTLFLGSCALELHMKSRKGQHSKSAGGIVLSAREILLSFFCDLGFLQESQCPPPARLCFVGMDIEYILWPLFEYYATVDESIKVPEGERVRMTAPKFARFMAEIAGTPTDGAEAIYRRVMKESRRGADGASGKVEDSQMEMYFDDFYVAIFYIQQERNKSVTYATPGEAVRQWMQQTQ